MILFSNSAAAEWQGSGGCYEITSRTVLPHLDEMRRINKVVEVIIEDHDANGFFPVLQSPSFNGCALVAANSRDSLALICETVSAASGYATLAQTSASSLKGDLYVKMGGKNMTFSQHITAVKRNHCSPLGESMERVGRRIYADHR